MTDTIKVRITISLMSTRPEHVVLLVTNTKIILP